MPTYIEKPETVSGNAQVYGNAKVYGNVRVSGNAQVSGDARVSGDALIEKQKDILFFQAQYYVTAYKLKNKKVFLQYGCEGFEFSKWTPYLI